MVGPSDAGFWVSAEVGHDLAATAWLLYTVRENRDACALFNLGRKLAIHIPTCRTRSV